MTKNQLAESVVEKLDELFPKGDKRRGDALVLLAVATTQAKAEECKRIRSELYEEGHKRGFGYQFGDTDCIKTKDLLEALLAPQEERE